MAKRYTREDKLAAVERCAAEIGKSPLMFSDYREWHRLAPDRRALPSGVVIGLAHDFAELCDELGVAASVSVTNSDSSGPHYYTRSMIREIVQRFLDETLPVPPTTASYKSWRDQQAVRVPDPRTVFEAFAGWKPLLHELGVDRIDGVWYSEAEKVAAIQRCAAETGLMPLRFADYSAWYRLAADRASLPHADSLGRGEGFLELCDLAGVAGVGSTPDSRRAWMLEVVQRFVDETHPSPPTSKAYDRWRQQNKGLSAPTRDTIHRNFGGWRDLMGEMGFTGRMSNQAYTESEKVVAVKRCAEETGQVPLLFSAYKDWYRSSPDRDDLPSPDSIGLVDDFMVLCERGDVKASRSYSRSMMVDEVRRFVAETHPAKPSSPRYKKWRAEQDVPVPSVCTLRANFGGWKVMLSDLGIVDGKAS